MGNISNYDPIQLRKLTSKEHSFVKHEQPSKLNLNKIDLTIKSNENSVILNQDIKEMNEKAE